MNSFWFAIGLFGLSFSASASPADRFDSVYNRIRGSYRTAGVPESDALVGWYAGRCVTPKAPNHRVASLLTTFVRRGKIVTVFFTDEKMPENHFDRLAPETEKEIADWIREYGPKMPEFKRRETYWEFVYPTKTDTYSFRVRGTSRTKVLMSFINRDNDWACTFFKKVHR